MEALKGVAPEVVSESGVDLEKLAILIGEDKNLSDKLERYNFTWPDKRKAIKSALTPSSGTLRPAPKESVNWDNTKNLYIEGDNLEVLKLLQKSYFGKIKMIYIDPPYNTGKEFVYPDDYADNIQNYLELTGQINESGRRITTNTETSGRYHTNWLNMIYPRLKLARDLLSDDGVIFISIDDHEIHNLRKICDEIFGEDNFVADLIWLNKEGGGSSDSKLFRIKHEHILCFSKNIELIQIKGIPINNEDRYKGIDEYYEQRGPYYLQKLGMGSIQYSKSLDYPIIAPDNSVIMPADNNSGKKACWRWSKDKYEKNYERGFIVIKRDSSKEWTVYTKQYLKCDNDGNTIDRRQRPMGIINDFSSTQASKYLESISIKFFNYSKPKELIKYLIDRIVTEKSIILDFFSGSATTAHAVMELNKEDGGSRQFIMVQLPEPCGKDTEAFKAGYKNICEIGKERIRRVIKKIEAEYAESEKSAQGELNLDAPAKQKPDLGFKVFKLDTSNFIPWDSNPDNLSEESLQRSLSNIKLDRSQQDLLYELFLKLGVTLNTPYQKVELAGKYMYDIGYGSIYACLDDDLDMDFCKAMIAYHDAQFPKEHAQDKKEERELEKYRLETTTFIFRDSSFADDNIKTNILQTLRQMGLTNIRAI